MAKTLRDRIVEALKKESLTTFELSERFKLSERLGVDPYYFLLLLRLEEEGLIEYDSATDKWRLKRR